jgi:hypothetical protein
MVRLEPDTVLVDDTDDSNWHSEAPSGKRRDAIERAVRWAVENVVTSDGGHPLGLLRRENVG